MAQANILTFALALSRIPSRKSVGQSKDYLDMSPFNEIFVEVVPASRNVPTLPGTMPAAPRSSPASSTYPNGAAPPVRGKVAKR